MQIRLEVKGKLCLPNPQHTPETITHLGFKFETAHRLINVQSLKNMPHASMHASFPSARHLLLSRFIPIVQMSSLLLPTAN